MLRIAIKLNSIADKEIPIADADGNGKITASDAILILRYSIGLEHDTEYIGRTILI